MEKGTIFLVLTVLIIVAVLYFLSFQYERPAGELGETPANVTPGTPRGSVVKDCELNLTCFEEAVQDDCKIVAFLIPDPFNDTAYFDGRILGLLLSKCEIYIEDPETKESMRCNIDESLFREVQSIDGLKTVCSGDLLDRMLVLV